MLLLKLLAPIAVVLLIVLQILLKRGWSNPFITKRKRFLVHVPKVIVGLTLLTIVVILTGHYSSKNLESTIQKIKLDKDKQITFLKKSAELNMKFAADNDSIADANLNYLKGIMKSFVEVALKSYPALDSTTALDKLGKELKAGNEVAASEIFRPFSNARKQAIKMELKKIRRAYQGAPRIKFHVDRKTRKNDTIIRNLESLLIDSGFSTDFELGTFPRSDIARSWEIHTYSKHAELIQNILHHIKPYINPNYALARRDVRKWNKLLGKFPENEVHFYIYTNPNFNNDGQITY